MRRHKTQKGQVMLELAMVTPVLMLLCYGAMDLSRVYRGALVAAGAARAGVHFASQSDSSGDDMAGIIAAAKQDAQNASNVTVAVEQYCTCALGGEAVSCTTTCSTKSKYVKVTAQVPFSATLSLPGVPSSFNVKSVSHVRVQ
jgi:Flp pilus assembly protein TadG